MEGCDKRSCEELANGIEVSAEDVEVQLVGTGTDCGHVVLFKEGVGEFVAMKVVPVNVATLEELSNAEAKWLLFVAVKISMKH